jgi:hypothetical protein
MGEPLGVVGVGRTLVLPTGAAAFALDAGAGCHGCSSRVITTRNLLVSKQDLRASACWYQVVPRWPSHDERQA